MNKFRKKAKAGTEITTASLPDIVFLLLFFFMVSATIRTKEEKVGIVLPEARQLVQVDKKILIREIAVGVPGDPALGSEPRIAVDSKVIGIEDIPQWVYEERETLPEVYKDQMIILLRADESVHMGLIADIQEKLRESKARKILYRTLEE